MKPEKQPSKRKPIQQRFDDKKGFYAAIEAVASKVPRKALAAAWVTVPAAAGFVGLAWMKAPWFAFAMLGLLAGWVAYLALQTNGRSKRNRPRPAEPRHHPEGAGATQPSGEED